MNYCHFLACAHHIFVAYILSQSGSLSFCVPLVVNIIGSRKLGGRAYYVRTRPEVLVSTILEKTCHNFTRTAIPIMLGQAFSENMTLYFVIIRGSLLGKWSGFTNPLIEQNRTNKSLVVCLSQMNHPIEIFQIHKSSGWNTFRLLINC